MKKKVSVTKTKKGAAKAPKAAKQAKPAKAAKATKATKGIKPKAAAKAPVKAKAAVKPAAKPKPAASAKPKPKSKSKPAPAPKKVVKAKSAALPGKLPVRKPVAPIPKPEAVADDIEAIPSARKSPGGGEDKAGLDNVMASLSKIFGGRDFLSDADLDAFLESKIASGEIPPSAALDPLDEAQSLVYEAWNTEGPEKIHLARRALDLSRNCADAYVILADEDAKSLPAALDLYRKGVEAAKRSLDPSIFAKSAGKFWDIMETRPYMRARLGLAECLWDLGKKAEALEHLRDLLRLNPKDNQGVRYILVQCLLESGADEELGELLGRYPEDTSPEFLYTRALWTFRRQGPGPIADSVLTQAIRANPHVPAFLLKLKKLAKDLTGDSGPGTVGEAEAYASGGADAWNKTLGAADWLSGHATG